jgi:hypothetical protein
VIRSRWGTPPHPRRGLKTPLFAAALLAGGCEAPPPVPPPAPSAVETAPPAPSAAPPSAFGTYHSRRFELRVALPDGHGWRIDDHSGPWLSATHEATGSALLVRTWTEDGRATRARCEDQARLWQKLPDPGVTESVQRQSINAPDGFDTLVQVGVVPGKPGAPFEAFAVAFGARAHRCFAFVYTTSASGPGAEAIVGERLAAIVERSLGGVVIESALTPRIPREPGP